MLKSPSNAQEIRLSRSEQQSRAQSPATMEALKTSFLPNLSMDSTIVATTHFCPMCGQQFESPLQATEHMHLCHGGLSVVAGVGGVLLTPHHVSAGVGDTLKIDYPCHNCDDKFSSEQDLEEHHRLVHQPPAFLARCPACSFYGISAAALQESAEYKCVHCGSVCTASALTASQPSYDPQTPDNMPSMAPQDMKLPAHDNIERQYLQQQLQQQEEQQQIEMLQQQSSSHSDEGLDDGGGGGSQQVPLKVPPLTVKLNKNINGSSSVMHPHVIIKEEPLNGDCAEGSPTSVPVYTIHQASGVGTSVVVSAASTQVICNNNEVSAGLGNLTTTIVGGVSKIRHKCPDCPKTFKTPGTLAMHHKVHTGEAE